MRKLKCNRALASLKGGIMYPNIYGVVYFEEVLGGTEVTAEIWGLPLYRPAILDSQPVGPFGFHIHEFGICEITDPNNPFDSAGGHYNPTNQPHGNHAGDLPVLFSNNGYSMMKVFTNRFKPRDVIGRSIIIHENPDDYRSQPAGNSGKRIACGIICEIE